MPVTTLTLEDARRMIGDVFVYHMPFNRELGLRLTRFEQDYAEIAFDNNEKLVGNIAQRILHGGVIAAVLDVAAGLVCVGNSLVRHEPLIKEQLQMKLAKMGTIDLRVDYLRPGRGERFIAAAKVVRIGSKICATQMTIHNEKDALIATGNAVFHY